MQLPTRWTTGLDLKTRTITADLMPNCSFDPLAISFAVQPGKFGLSLHKTQDA